MANADDGLVRRTVRVMRAVAGHPDGVGLSELARETGLSKATVLRILGELVAESWVAVNPAQRTYRVSLGMLAVVGRLLDADSAFMHLKRSLRRLSDRTQETAGFDLLLPPHVVVVAQEAGPQLISQAIRPVPRTQPVWVTATGRVFLADQDEAHIREVYGETFPASTARARSAGIAAFVEGLVAVRETGYAVVRDELEQGASAIGAPVEVDGQLRYAVWIGGPTFRLAESREAELAASVVETAGELSALLRANPIDFVSPNA